MANKRIIKDLIAEKAALLAAVFCGLMVFLLAMGLCMKAWPIIRDKPILGIILSTSWGPQRGEFGMLPFILGTIWVTGIALVIAVPISLLTAIFLSEYAPAWARRLSRPFLDLLAGIPSVVYGIWGVIMVVPLVKQHLAPLFGANTSGYSVLAAGILLSIMIFPVIIHVTIEVFQSVPHELRDASLALGATRWQTVKHVLLRKALPGIIAANMLGFSRAFGETMAVLMVAGNVVAVPRSVFDPAYALPALIANNYGEMMSVPLYDSALLLAALILLAVVVFFTMISRYILNRLKSALIL